MSLVPLSMNSACARRTERHVSAVRRDAAVERAWIVITHHGVLLRQLHACWPSWLQRQRTWIAGEMSGWRKSVA